MFRKILAAATTALVAGALSLGAVAGPALADGSDPTTPAATTDTSSTTSSDATTPPVTAPESTTPAASTPDATTPAPAPAAAPDSAPSPAAQPPAAAAQKTTAPTTQVEVPKSCLPSSAVSYTYDKVANSGEITVDQLDSSSYTNELCTGFYVTAVSWSYVTSGTWPQNLVEAAPANNGLEITSVGHYKFGATVACGQGDIYASTSPLPTPPAQLTDQNAGYTETFLSGMGFAGPVPTYMVSDQSCHVVDVNKVYAGIQVHTACGVPASISWTDTGKVTYALTFGNGTTGYNEVTATTTAPWIFQDNLSTYTFGFQLGEPTKCTVVVPDPTVTPSVCQSGTAGDGAITVGLNPGIVYRITGPNGFDVTPTIATTPVPAGAYTVTASPLNSNYQLDYTHPNQWPFTITVPSATDCGDLPTFADFTIDATPSNATCSTSGGTITVGPAEFASVVNFFVDGKPVAPGKVKVAAGDHVVTGTPVDPANTVDNSVSVHVGSSSAICPTQLKTLALTGTDNPTPWVIGGLGLLQLGLALVAVGVVRRRMDNQSV